jgi:DNA phosphorothioation-dependent restriction protein DptG
MEIKSFEYSCEFKGCEKAYSTKYNLKRHIESVHQSIKRFQCDLCNKFLSSKQNLQEHYFTHSNEKLFKCIEPGCLQTFRQRSQLSNHRKMHRELFLLKEQLKTSEEEFSVFPKLFEERVEEGNYFNFWTSEKDFPVLPLITGPQPMIKLPQINFG